MNESFQATFPGDNFATPDSRRAIQQLWGKKSEHDSRISALEKIVYSKNDTDFAAIIEDLGKLTETYVGYGDSNDKLTGDANLTWDASGQELSVKGTTNAIIEDSNSSGVSYPLKIYHRIT